VGAGPWGGGRQVPDGVILSKDAKTALVASTTVFINYLAATYALPATEATRAMSSSDMPWLRTPARLAHRANDVATGKSKTLTSAAVLQALDELGFEDFVGPVKAAVDGTASE